MTSVDLRYLEPRRWRRLAAPCLFERCGLDAAPEVDVPTRRRPHTQPQSDCPPSSVPMNGTNKHSRAIAAYLILPKHSFSRSSSR